MTLTAVRRCLCGAADATVLPRKNRISPNLQIQQPPPVRAALQPTARSAKPLRWSKHLLSQQSGGEAGSHSSQSKLVRLRRCVPSAGFAWSPCCRCRRTQEPSGSSQNLNRRFYQYQRARLPLVLRGPSQLERSGATRWPRVRPQCLANGCSPRMISPSLWINVRKECAAACGTLAAEGGGGSRT